MYNLFKVSIDADTSQGKMLVESEHKMRAVTICRNITVDKRRELLVPLLLELKVLNESTVVLQW